MQTHYNGFKETNSYHHPSSFSFKHRVSLLLLFIWNVIITDLSVYVGCLFCSLLCMCVSIVNLRLVLSVNNYDWSQKSLFPFHFCFGHAQSTSYDHRFIYDYVCGLLLLRWLPLTTAHISHVCICVHCSHTYTCCMRRPLIINTMTHCTGLLSNGIKWKCVIFIQWAANI